MYSNSFWDTAAGQRLASSINAIAGEMQKTKKQKMFQYDREEELISSLEEKLAEGYRFIGVSRYFDKAGNDKFVLILEYDE